MTCSHSEINGEMNNEGICDLLPKNICCFKI